MPTREELSKQSALFKAGAGLGAIMAYAREYCMNPEITDHSDADLIAAGLSVLIKHDPTMSLDIAANLAEDVNYHELAAIIRPLFSRDDTPIKSGTCPYCSGPYTLAAGGCQRRCAESQRLEQMTSDAADAEELIGIAELDG